MNIIVDRPKLVRVVLLYLNNNFGDLTPKSYVNIPGTVFYVDKKGGTVLEYEEDNEFEPTVWVDGTLLWLKIKNIFYLNYNEIQSILELWLKETYNFEGVSVSQASLGLDLNFD
jgi:hypothetical protein